LSSILLPAMQQAKATALRIQCTSNLRQLGVASEIYADSYDDRLCAPPSGDGAWFVFLYPCHRDANLYHCPADKRKVYQGAWTGIPGGLPGGMGYLGNGDLNYWKWYYKKRSMFKFPTKTMNHMDGTNHWYRLGYNPVNFRTNGAIDVANVNTRYHARHRGTMNALFLDSHVQIIPWRKYPCDPNDNTMPTSNQTANIFWRGTKSGTAKD